MKRNKPLRSSHVYEVRPRKDHRGVDLISEALAFRRLWYGEPNAVSNAIDYAKFRSRSHDAVIRAYDEGHAGETPDPDDTSCVQDQTCCLPARG